MNSNKSENKKLNNILAKIIIIILIYSIIMFLINKKIVFLLDSIFTITIFYFIFEYVKREFKHKFLVDLGILSDIVKVKKENLNRESHYEVKKKRLIKKKKNLQKDIISSFIAHKKQYSQVKNLYHLKNYSNTTKNLKSF